MSLSISNIYDIFNSIVNEEKIDYYMINFLLENFSGINVPNEINGWSGIDSKACYLILLEAGKQVETKIPKMFKKDEILTIYNLINEEYKRCCLKDGFEKIPTLFELEKRLKMKLNKSLIKN